jgi:hypothetical protein
MSGLGRALVHATLGIDGKFHVLVIPCIVWTFDRHTEDMNILSSRVSAESMSPRHGAVDYLMQGRLNLFFRSDHGGGEEWESNLFIGKMPEASPRCLVADLGLA